MTWDDIFKIVLSILASTGGVGGIIVLSVKFASNIIAKRLEERYSLKLNKELEQYKSSLENKKYISKVRFDREFEMYQELSEKNLTMVYDVGNTVAILRGLYKDDQDKIGEHAVHFCNSLGDAEFTTKRFAPFIDKLLYEKYHNMQMTTTIAFRLFDFWCMNDDNATFVFSGKKYTRETAASTITELQKEISDCSNEILNDIRNYLDGLSFAKE